jgi:hypothetical protein
MCNFLRIVFVLHAVVPCRRLLCKNCVYVISFDIGTRPQLGWMKYRAVD